MSMYYYGEAIYFTNTFNTSCFYGYGFITTISEGMQFCFEQMRHENGTVFFLALTTTSIKE